MRLGSLFAGLGGLDLACEWGLGATAAWQLDLVGHHVRRRHWPSATQHAIDIRLADPRDFPRVDIIAGGFSCKGVSTAGKGELLGHPETRATYLGLLRFVDVHRPDLVVIENTPRMLTCMRERMEGDYGDLGYALTWVRCRALDAGAPHLRRRVFCLLELGGRSRGVLDVDRSGAWTPSGERPWPTPTEGDSKATGSRCLDSSAHDGTSLTDAVRPDRAVAGERPWATPRASEDRSPGDWDGREGGAALSEQTRPWATPSDHKGANDGQRRGQLGEQLPGKRLNPEWVETLMGLPQGWTALDSWQPGLFGARPHRLVAQRRPRWPRGRYPKGWDRTQPWPGYAWEPGRTIPDERGDVLGRPARLRMLGNAVCPQQGAAAIQAWSTAAVEAA